MMGAGNIVLYLFIAIFLKSTVKVLFLRFDATRS